MENTLIDHLIPIVDKTYVKHKNMIKSVKACHRLVGTKKPMYDQLYMLKILPYGKLQKEYKDVVLDN